MTTVQYSYVWVNKGEWRTDNSDVDAIRQAGLYAFRHNLKWYKPDRIVIVRMPCDENHIDLCDHLFVTMEWNDDENT